MNKIRLRVIDTRQQRVCQLVEGSSEIRSDGQKLACHR